METDAKRLRGTDAKKNRQAGTVAKKNRETAAKNPPQLAPSQKKPCYQPTVAKNPYCRRKKPQPQNTHLFGPANPRSRNVSQLFVEPEKPQLFCMSKKTWFMVYHRIPCFKRFRNVYIHGWLATHAKTTKRNASKKHLRKRQPTTCRRLCSTFAVKDLWGTQFTVVALLSDLPAGHQVPGLGHHWLCSGFLPVSFFPGTRKPTCFKWIENGYFHSFPILKDLVHHGI